MLVFMPVSTGRIGRGSGRYQQALTLYATRLPKSTGEVQANHERKSDMCPEGHSWQSGHFRSWFQVVIFNAGKRAGLQPWPCWKTACPPTERCRGGCIQQSWILGAETEDDAGMGWLSGRIESQRLITNFLLHIPILRKERLMILLKVILTRIYWHVKNIKKEN